MPYRMSLTAGVAACHAAPIAGLTAGLTANCHAACTDARSVSPQSRQTPPNLSDCLTDDSVAHTTVCADECTAACTAALTAACTAALTAACTAVRTAVAQPTRMMIIGTNRNMSAVVRVSCRRSRLQSDTTRSSNTTAAANKNNTGTWLWCGYLS